ncbi:ComEA family DNA-binding protein [Mariniluteicoccus endophyticus]
MALELETPPRRGRQTPVVSDHVRARLDALLAETPPRRALVELEPAPLAGRDCDDPDATLVRSELPPVAAVGTNPRPAYAFTRKHLLVVAAMLVLGTLVGLYALTRARAIPIEHAAVQVAEAPAPAPSASPTPSATPLRVHVTGAVNRPGVVTLRPGARVQDAIDAAGGLTPQARPGELNLAAALDDGQQVVVGDVRRPGGEVRGDGNVPPSGAPGATSAAPNGKPAQGARLNLNTATVDQLDALPGVGPVTAQKIVAWRTEHGRFSKVAELQEVPGIGPKSFAELEPLVTV